MGTDKSFVLLDGKPLIQHVIERAAGLNAPNIVILYPHLKAFMISEAQIRASDPELRSFTDLNTPAELTGVIKGFNDHF